MNQHNRLICWWFGCEPDWGSSFAGEEPTPCLRCGARDTTYNDRVGDTRHNRFKDHVARLIAPLHFRYWFPKPCQTCGLRDGHAPDCDVDDLPF